jgi:hypothetical protein
VGLALQDFTVIEKQSLQILKMALQVIGVHKVDTVPKDHHLRDIFAPREHTAMQQV